MEYSDSIRALGPLILEELSLTLPADYRSENVKAAMLSLLAFSCSEDRLGFALARWWPYALLEDQKILLASIQQYEELKQWSE